METFRLIIHSILIIMLTIDIFTSWGYKNTIYKNREDLLKLQNNMLLAQRDIEMLNIEKIAKENAI